MKSATSSAAIHTSPSAKKRTVRTRLANDEARGRKHLIRDEALMLAKAAKENRHGARDSLMILMAYQHALRVSELIGLKWHR